ncbi:MAG: glucose-6-phosphate isomerase [Proteobacteria bacterium]|nr:glucose-6-phosphate isomerase [Pseudomonadota bacterium]
MPRESPLSVSLDLALKGAGAPDPARYEGMLAKADTALANLRKAYDDGSMELLRVPGWRDDIVKAREVSQTLCKGTSDIAVLGIGGSSLGGQALAQLRPADAQGPRVSFFDNPDPFTFDAALKRFDLKTTRFIVISKSGGTAEPLALALAAADAIDHAGGGKYLKYHFVAITEPRPNPVRKFAEDMGCAILDHPLGVGGRFSVLTVVGMLPAIAMGLNVEAIREGAESVLASLLSGKRASDVPAAAGAALHQALASEGRLRETVLWSYADRLSLLSDWWRQLWGESLGKDGQGSTPIAVTGPVDQHSQLQLFLDGPGGALFTVLSTDTKGQGAEIPRARAEALGLSYLAGRRIGDLVDAEMRATSETLAKRGRPVRRMHVAKVDERAFGALFMHFMLETVLMGRLMGVDPFGQPAVEEGKVLARQYMESSA